ncbi:PREDICTED: leucine-rich repeat extensin-like protein 5-like [Lipotes vexillifer]|uniref:Leucine-rich repeat extensin-like protein 5-like n=1 Tax=Lipotes vexillifer TaxID=118797 RepID=A0A340XZQ1_LIPVE|nr:PREDICTED: leucine-rich repeat extensin-like protein 5-like [Lipotes vexillifer]
MGLPAPGGVVSTVHLLRDCGCEVNQPIKQQFRNPAWQALSKSLEDTGLCVALGVLPAGPPPLALRAPAGRASAQRLRLFKEQLQLPGCLWGISEEGFPASQCGVNRVFCEPCPPSYVPPLEPLSTASSCVCQFMSVLVSVRPEVPPYPKCASSPEGPCQSLNPGLVPTGPAAQPSFRRRSSLARSLSTQKEARPSGTLRPSRQQASAGPQVHSAPSSPPSSPLSSPSSPPSSPAPPSSSPSSPLSSSFPPSPPSSPSPAPLSPSTSPPPSSPSPSPSPLSQSAQNPETKYHRPAPTIPNITSTIKTTTTTITTSSSLPHLQRQHPCHHATFIPACLHPGCSEQNTTNGGGGTAINITITTFTIHTTTLTHLPSGWRCTSLMKTSQEQKPRVSLPPTSIPPETSGYGGPELPPKGSAFRPGCLNSIYNLRVQPLLGQAQARGNPGGGCLS